MTTTLATAPAVDFDPYDPETLRDPRPGQDMVRDAAPVVRIERYRIWATGRYSVARAVLKEWETFISSAGVGIEDMRVRNEWVEPGLLLRVDPPEHTRAKRIMQRILSPANLEDLRGRLLEEAHRRIRALVIRGRFDAVTDLAQPYVLQVFPDAVGISQTGRENLLPWGDMSFNAQGPRNALFLRSAERVEDVQRWVYDNCQRETLAPGGLGQVIYDHVDRGEIEAREAWLLVRGLLTAGLDTTIHTLGIALHYLATNSDQFTLLRADPGLARNAFEEALRLNSTVQNFYRTTSRATEIEGTEIPGGAKLLLLFGAANRDPDVWDDPERFDITRRTQGHLGFGWGVHQCVGQIIARLEGECLLTALAEEASSLEPDGPVSWHLNNAVRGLSSAPLGIA